MKPSKAQSFSVNNLERDSLGDETWNNFIAESPQGVPYGCTWYLDAVWPEWKGIMVFSQQKLIAVMPFRVTRKFGIAYIFNPPLCQYLGIFFIPFEGKKTEQELTLKKRVVNAILGALPKKLSLVILNFAPEFDYPLPFFWSGYELRTRYSYWLENDADKQKLFRHLNERTRTYIHKAKKCGLKVVHTDNAGALIQLSRKKDSYLLDYGALERLWVALQTHKIGETIEVRDEQDRLHAGLIYMRWGKKIIHLFSASDPEVAQFGGMSLAVWHSIEQAGEDVEVIDFEGSMIESIEHFFRSFGGKPIPYLQIRKNSFPKPFRWLLEK